MSVFLTIPREQWVAHNELAFAIRDAYPVNEGHTLIVPKRLVASFFELTAAERGAMLELVDAIKADLDSKLQPDGYNIGINDGAAAGQTVPHLHIHVIPRWVGDVDDPRGGVRFVIPERGDYERPGRLPRASRPPGPWRAQAAPGTSTPPHWLVTGGLDDPFYAHLRPALLQASSVFIVAAFVVESGVEQLREAIKRALAGGAHIRVITGDYLHLTQARALRRLLDWSQLAHSAPDPDHGSLELRLIETAELDGRSFHPKSWRVEGPEISAAWVGSSNWSRSALSRGVEWNLRVDTERQPEAYAELSDAFTGLWRAARPLDDAWIDAYEARAPAPGPLARVLTELEDDDDTTTAPPSPRGVQIEALEALARAREQGRHRALVVLATGLGKTYLAAFDVRDFASHASPPPRVLFIAHRLELLEQAMETFRRVFPDRSFGLFAGNATQLDKQLVFASIQKLARPQQLGLLRPETFDYVIIDEGHHASANTYRRVLAHLSPRFLLGLTATPERADQADVAGLFDDHIAFRADLAEGIGRGELVPFHYVGLKDTIDYAPIPWSNYTLEELSSLASTQARMEKLWQAWQAYPGERTLVFCASIHHADFVSAWLRERGVEAAAVHTGPHSGERSELIEALGQGSMQALVAVDLFNEGLDIPRIDRVVMLRPTQSPVVFLQQLGRGLRVADGKRVLQVIDFVGNHKIFLRRVHTLLSLSPKPPSLRNYIDDPSVLTLPEGCAVVLEHEVIELLATLLPEGSPNETIRVYRELRDARELPPSPGELTRLRLNPASVHKRYGHWFGFVADEGDLSPAQRIAIREEKWLRHVERALNHEPLKLVVLEVLLQHHALFSGMAVERLCAASHELLARNPELVAAPAPNWAQETLAAWTGAATPWFCIVGAGGKKVFRSRLKSPTDPNVAAALESMTRELVDWRLASYRRRPRSATNNRNCFDCKVKWNRRDPILFLPSEQRSTLPSGETTVLLRSGEAWSFRFVKIAINVARPVGQQANALPDLLRTWFGPRAGQPGTDDHVRFEHGPDGWRVSPLGGLAVLPTRSMLLAYPSLRAAAGSDGASAMSLESRSVRLPVEVKDNRFATRAAGRSMAGGHNPIHDGDWVVLEWARGLGLGAVIGRVVLLARGDADEGQRYHLKRVVQTDDGLHLRSDNPYEPELSLTEDTVVIARVVDSIRPEQLAPPAGTSITDWNEAFAIDEPPGEGWSRIDGHLFISIDAAEFPPGSNGVEIVVPDRTPAETAFVLTRSKHGWRYVGVGRWVGSAWHTSVPGS